MLGGGSGGISNNTSKQITNDETSQVQQNDLDDEIPF